MAKQRRLSSRRVPSKPVRRPDTRVLVPAPVPTGQSAVIPPDGGGPRLDAVGTYQSAVEALQQHDYARAKSLLASILERYPEEKELHERVRLYINVCERQAAPPDRTPRTLEERVYAATLAINAGAYESGLTELQQALAADPTNDHVHYMLGVVYALRQDFAASMSHLQRAIELNADNRFLAMQDTDLVALREGDPGFRTIIENAVCAGRSPRAADGPRLPR
jgi:tetratricopeptide (TPR) repeat protein